MKQIIQEIKLESAQNVYHKLLVIYLLLLFAYCIVFAYFGMSFLLINGAITFAISIIIYDELYEEKYQSLINIWIQLSGTYNIVCDIIVMGWGYGFELFLVGLIAIYYSSAIKNSYFKIIIVVAQSITYLVLHYLFAHQDINYGNDDLKHISYISGFLAIVFVFFFLHQNLNIVGAVDILNLQRKKKDYQRIAEHDFLTGFYTRAPMRQMLTSRLSMLKNEELKSICIILCDLDNFKNINDTLGHIFGDTILSRVAASLKSSFIKYGKLCRWGGEKFLIILENKNATDIKDIIESARLKVEKLNPEGIKVSVTFGALYLTKIEADFELEPAISIVDELMYYGKSQGKNRLVFKNYEYKK